MILSLSFEYCVNMAFNFFVRPARGFPCVEYLIINKNERLFYICLLDIHIYICYNIVQ